MTVRNTPSRGNNSGVAGVHYTEYRDKRQNLVRYWVATWDENRVHRHRNFNCDILGDEAAFDRAVGFRQAVVELLEGKIGNNL